MSYSVTKAGVVILLVAEISLPALAAPANRMPAQNATATTGKAVQKPATPSRPAGLAGTVPGSASKNIPATAADRPVPKSYQQPTSKSADRVYQGNQTAAPTNAGTSTRTNGNNTIVAGNTVVVAGGNRNPYPVYRTPNGGYYRPPNGGYYRPPPPPPGGWHGGYYPPPRYYYDDGPSVGEVIAGVAVTTSLLMLLSAATQPKPPQTVVVQGAPPPPPPPPSYVPPPKSNGAPASINADLGGLTPEVRPTASVCLTEAARQIGATGGSEIRLDRIVDVEQGNGGYRVRLNLIGVYPDQQRSIPMYCRATPEKIVELTFG